METDSEHGILAIMNFDTTTNGATSICRPFYVVAHMLRSWRNSQINVTNAMLTFLETAQLDVTTDASSLFRPLWLVMVSSMSFLMRYPLARYSRLAFSLSCRLLATLDNTRSVRPSP